MFTVMDIFVALLINLSNIEITNNNLGMPRIKPGAAA